MPASSLSQTKSDFEIQRFRIAPGNGSGPWLFKTQYNPDIDSFTVSLLHFYLPREFQQSFVMFFVFIFNRKANGDDATSVIKGLMQHFGAYPLMHPKPVGEI